MNSEIPKELDEFDRKILHVLQQQFPVCPYPYRDIAAAVQSDEETVLQRVRHLYERGFIRRLGASINSREIGYVSTLVALQVADGFIDKVAATVNSFSGVTHNYLREGEYNVWFTVIAANQERLQDIVQTVGSQAGIEKMITLPAKRVFKINVTFPLAAG